MSKLFRFLSNCLHLNQRAYWVFFNQNKQYLHYVLVGTDSLAELEVIKEELEAARERYDKRNKLLQDKRRKFHERSTEGA